MIVSVSMERDFTVVPGDLMRDDRLSAEALALAAHLAGCGETGAIVDQLAAKARMTGPAVQDALCELEQCGHVRRSRVVGTGASVADRFVLGGATSIAGGQTL